MANRNTSLGGTDYVVGEIVQDYDMDDTNDRIIDTYKEIFDQKYGDSVLTGCEVTEQAVPDQTVQVSSGKILVNGLYYNVTGDATVNLTAADVTNPRWDIVSISSSDVINITSGTAAVTPVVPTLPTDDVPLATVYRVALDNIIGTADIKDGRRLIDKDYVENSNASVQSNSVTYYDFKVITIPAFRCLKQITINYDVGMKQSQYISSMGSSSGYYTSTRVLVNAVVVDTIIGYIVASDADGISGGTGTSSITLDSEDYDFTQPIIIKLQLRSASASTSSVHEIKGINHLFSVNGK